MSKEPFDYKEYKRSLSSGITHCYTCGGLMKVDKMYPEYDTDDGELLGHTVSLKCSSSFFKCSARRYQFRWGGYVGINVQSEFSKWR